MTIRPAAVAALIAVALAGDAGAGAEGLRLAQALSPGLQRSDPMPRRDFGRDDRLEDLRESNRQLLDRQSNQLDRQHQLREQQRRDRATRRLDDRGRPMVDPIFD